LLIKKFNYEEQVIACCNNINSVDLLNTSSFVNAIAGAIDRDNSSITEVVLDSFICSSYYDIYIYFLKSAKKVF